MISHRHNTKDYITIALYYLMSKRDYESITVTDICAKARVSRMSFYRYYNNKEDIFINYCDERFEDFFRILSEKNVNDIYTFIYEVFAYIQRYARQVTILKKANRENILIEKFTDYGSYLSKHINLSMDNNPINNRLFAAFLAGGIANVLLEWFDLGFDVPIDSMADRVYNIFTNFGQNFSKK